MHAGARRNPALRRGVAIGRKGCPHRAGARGAGNDEPTGDPSGVDRGGGTRIRGFGRGVHHGFLPPGAPPSDRLPAALGCGRIRDRDTRGASTRTETSPQPRRSPSRTRGIDIDSRGGRVPPTAGAPSHAQPSRGPEPGAPQCPASSSPSIRVAGQRGRSICRRRLPRRDETPLSLVHGHAAFERRSSDFWPGSSAGEP